MRVNCITFAEIKRTVHENKQPLGSFRRISGRFMELERVRDHDIKIVLLDRRRNKVQGNKGMSRDHRHN